MHDLVQHTIVFYISFFIACFFEGEISVLAASIAVQHRSGSLVSIFFISIIATLMSDWFWFYLGRKKGIRLIRGRDWARKKYLKMNKWLNAYPILITFLYRYMYGLRTIVPAMFGMSKISAVRFGIVSFLSTIFWGIILFTLSIKLGNKVIPIIKDFQHIEILFIIGVLVLLILKFLIQGLKKKSEVS